jgi:signal transduction histidine kinase/FixJ family two-component response regulator
MTDRTPLRVLVIEDDPDARSNLCDILELDEHEVEVAGTVAEVLRRTDWRDIHVVILDRRLPDGTADDLLPALKERAPDAAVLVVTGFADVEGAITALRRGASDYLLKPINPDALRAGMDRIAEARRARRELNVRAEQQAVVAELGWRALQTSDLPRLMEAIVDRVGTTLRVESCRITELLPDGRTLLVTAAYGWAPEVVGTATVPVGPSSMPAYALSSDVPVVVEDFSSETRFTVPDVAREHGFQSGIAVVIHGGGRPYGLLGVGSKRRRRFSKADVDFLQSIANVLAAFLGRTESEARAVQAERLAAIGQMVAGLAHESRNALQRSQACLEMLAFQVEDRPEAQELVARIQRAQDHLHHLYEEVRGYAAPIRISRSRCDLREVWRETWANLEVARRGRTVRLAETVLTDDPVCSVDRHALEQVFRNVLENAIAASPDPGEVTVEVREAVANNVPALEISFRDDGPGLSPEQRARIFEPFYTTKTHGTGLGMPIARRIIEAHGGRIRVGDPQAGAEILMTLPRN